MSRKSSAAELLPEPTEECDAGSPADADHPDASPESGEDPIPDLLDDADISPEEMDLEKINLNVSAEEKPSDKADSANGKKPKIPILSTVQAYFNRIAKIPVLSREEEMVLGGKILAAREKLARVNDGKELIVAELDKEGLGETEKLALLARNEKLDYEYLAADATVAALEEELVLHNLRLVVGFARRYMSFVCRFDLKNIQLLDLIQEGNIGMRHAAAKFDPARGYRFSTYASWWIRQSINRAITDTGRVIRLPVHMWEKNVKLFKTVEMLKKRKNFNPDYEPGPEEIAEVMDTTADKVKNIQNLPQVTTSCDNPVKDEQGVRFIDLTPDEKMPATDQETIRKSENSYLGNLLDVLTPREQFVIKQRFGLEPESFRDAEGKTLEEVGVLMEVTRERVRQIQDKALEKLRRAAQRLGCEHDAC